MEALSRLAQRSRDLAVLASLDPLRHQLWTPPQEAFLRLRPKSGVKLLRGGNQAVGKTTVGMAEVDYRCTGRHPFYATRQPPIEAWVVCTSWSQSVAIQRKFWDVCSKTMLTERTRDRFTHRNGWGKDNPVVEYLNGSIVRFRTTNQGPESMAGATIDYVDIDEPTEEEIFRELHKRLMRNGGEMGITLTPVNRDCSWLRKLVEDGVVEEVHARLTAENLIPVGSGRPLQLLDGTPMDQAWIDEQRRITPATWAPVVLDGEWETRPEGVWYSCFDKAKHVTDRLRLNPVVGPVYWALGFDYAAGDRPYGHVGVLAQVQPYRNEDGRPRERVYVADVAALGGHATNEEFARAVLTMLDRQGIRWTDLRSIHGDNPVQSRWLMKSNIATRNAIADELRVPRNTLMPPIKSAKEGPASSKAFDAGNQYVYARIASGDLYVHPRCTELIRAFETWDYGRMHPSKDVIDALRYALKPWIFPAGGTSNVTVRLR